MEKGTGYRLWLKLRVGTALATEETALTASVAGREVTIESGQSKPLAEASWLSIKCRGFETEEDARAFGEKLRRAVHMAGLCARVGVDAGDPGEDRAVSQINEDFLRRRGVLDPETRIVADIHGILVLPDDGKKLLFGRGRAELTVRSHADGFVRALEEAFPASDGSGGNCPSIRRAVRVLSLAEISTDPIAKVVLAISTIEGLATGPSWTDEQKKLIESTAAWVARTHGDGEETRQIVEAIGRIRSSSIGQEVRKLLAANDLSDLWQDWRDLYSKRSRLYHGRSSGDGEGRADHLAESELRALGQEATKLCGRIVLSMAIREGIPVPSQANVHFGVE